MIKQLELMTSETNVITLSNYNNAVVMGVTIGKDLKHVEITLTKEEVLELRKALSVVN